MRRFSSYGPVDKDLHYYVPRQALVDDACAQLVGEDTGKGGHYITVWAPRQRGKTWLMQQVKQKILALYAEQFAVFDFSLGALRGRRLDPADDIPGEFRELLQETLPGHPDVASWAAFRRLFSREHGLWDRPLILFIDEVDTIPPTWMDTVAGQFRELYLDRSNHWLHGLALIGVGTVLGVESRRGSPFNVQRSLHIPNLTEAEVNEMYRWYERESGQKVEQAVIERVFYETQGQPGLVSWLGELLTETYNENPAQAIDMRAFQKVYGAAVKVLPNNNILNIISKAQQPPYRHVVLEMFRTTQKIPFTYDDPRLSFLYLNGVVDRELEGLDEYYVKFPSPFVQKRLFNYFARTLFTAMDRTQPLFSDLDDTLTEDSLNVQNLLRRYEVYLEENRDWLFKDAPRRADLRIYEAVYHFNLYRYLAGFLQGYGGQVWPEFPTGNGKADLVLHHAGQVYAIEVKSFSTQYEYNKALPQAARYAGQLGLTEITLALFVEAVDDANRARYEVIYEDEETGVTVRPVFVATGA
jgi:hypothetical protein